MANPDDESRDESEEGGRLHIDIESYLQKVSKPSDYTDWLKNPKKWEPVLRKKVKENPESYEALEDLGFFLRVMRRFREAKKVLKKALKLAPRDRDGASVWLSMGLLHYDECDYEKAIQHFLEAIGLNEKHIRALYCLAHSYKQTKRFAEAEQLSITVWCRG